MEKIRDVVDALTAGAAQTVGASSTMYDDQPLSQYGLDSINCPACSNTGVQWREDENGVKWARECGCMAQRRSIKRIRRSGLADLVQRYTFERYQASDKKRAAIKDAALRFCEDEDGKWFFIAGESGSGKTHICTAICAKLLKRVEVRYMLWRDEAVKIKATVTDRAAYEELVQPLKNAPVLYIDDFLKGRVGEADINLAFEIINARYNDSGKRTLISSERTLPEIMQLDKALGSRIYERSRGFVVQPPDENWRLRP